MGSFTSWKTSSAGIALLLASVADIFHQISTGTLDTQALMTDFTAILGGLGLLAAKDANVTGGTIPATPEAATRV